MKDKIKEIYKIFTEKTKQPTIDIDVVKQSTSLFDSKLGGYPYIPKDFEYPKTSEGKPFNLFAQLNFEKLPKLPNFPHKGMLQIYFNPDDGAYGLELKDGFKIIYHENIIYDENKLITDLHLKPEEDSFPFQGEYKIIGELNKIPMSRDDYRFEKEYLSIYNREIGTNFRSVDDLGELEKEELLDEFWVLGHFIGGYPAFAQGDRRGYEKEFEEHSILLFQLYSEDNNGINWVDDGLGNFFITPEDLKNRDFSNVFYTWDCY